MPSNTRWKKLSQKLLLEHPRITVYEDEVELPSGHKTHYVRFAKNKDAACILAVNTEGKILLQREYSYPPNEWLYQVPGGAIEDGESPQDGAARELAEESSLKGDLKLLGWYYLDNRRKDSKFFVFLATNISEDTSKTQDIEEELEDYWFTEQEIDEMIRNGELVTYSGLAAWAFYKTTI
jgi:ADP-ribose pyrophosphatase YjhB (NUDIX family)